MISIGGVPAGPHCERSPSGGVGDERPEIVPRRRTRSCFLRLAGLCVVAVGCGPARLDVQHVEGTVLLDGRPLAGAGISLRPVTRGLGVAAFGRSGDDGRFVITSTLGGRPGAGAVAGDYAVMITKFAECTPTTVPPEFVDDADNSGRPTRQWFGKQKLPNDRVVLCLVPEAYGDADSSGLKASVQRGSNTFRFELDSAFQGSRAD